MMSAVKFTRIAIAFSALMLRLALGAGIAPTDAQDATPTATATPSVYPREPLYSKGKRVTMLHRPFNQVASGQESGGAAVSLSLPAVQGFATQLDYAWLTCNTPASTVTTALTISGIRGQPIVFDVVENSDIGAYLAINTDAIPAATRTTNITASLDAIAGGADCSLNLMYSFAD